MPKKSKKQKWFKPVRNSYLPDSWQGWLTYIPFIFYLAYSAAAIWHYVNDDIVAALIIAPNWVMATVVMTWVARQTS